MQLVWWTFCCNHLCLVFGVIFYLKFHLYTNKYIHTTHTHNTYTQRAHTHTHTHTLKEKSYKLSSDKMFRRSWHQIEKFWRLSGWAIIIFLKEVTVTSHLKPCYFMHSNNSSVLGIKPLRHRVEQAILKNSPLIAE